MFGVFPKEGIGPTLKTDGVPCLQVNGDFPLFTALGGHSGRRLSAAFIVCIGRGKLVSLTAGGCEGL